ncbi:hypothetical protein IFT84_20460 [Rhizobium sp. CFBP 8762]|uniref:hypothetical protein n=1 Tax=Rhizobium sp. CFBP 8762 TaxID=2775279 RepID=UPI00177D52D5|nr:hypothetical protein [Rhizobium sp. CFBP 8762]MBD8556886.1 hypothetical protein [Rhizobium sp. CFBP 8762]
MNALAPISPASTDLVGDLDRARALFDAGDVQAAKQLADLVYSTVKPLGDAVAKLKLQESLAACRRIQADALELVSYSEIRIADEWDRLAKEGKTLRGRPKSVVNEDTLTADSIGLTRDQIHKARKLRDKEAANPGFIRLVIEEKVREGVSPTKAAIRHAIGTKSHTAAEKGDQLYQTPIEAMRTLLALESFSGVVKEPAVGLGACLRPLEAAGYRVMIADLVDRGIVTQEGDYQQVGDFLLSDATGSEGVDIVTNPPYDDLANAFAAHALRVHKPGKMALLLNLNFMCGFEDKNRRYVMDEHPPSRIYVFAHRLPMMHREGWEGNKVSSQMNTAWFVWERNEDGSYGQGNPQIIRVMWDDYMKADPRPPGAGGHVAPMSFRAASPRSGPDDEFARETVRKTMEERIEEAQARALIWIGEHDQPFDAGTLRRGIGVRPSVADALIADFAERALIAADQDTSGAPSTWSITNYGWEALRTAAAVVHLRASYPAEDSRL